MRISCRNSWKQKGSPSLMALPSVWVLTSASPMRRPKRFSRRLAGAFSASVQPAGKSSGAIMIKAHQRWWAFLCDGSPIFQFRVSQNALSLSDKILESKPKSGEHQEGGEEYEMRHALDCVRLAI